MSPPARKLLIAVLVALAAAGCGSGGHDRGVPPRNDRTQVYALLASNELVGVALSPPRLTVRLRLGEGLDQFSPGRLLATSRDGTRVFVLVREPKRASIAVVAAASGRLRMRISLPAELDVRSLVMGARSGTLYVLANRKGTRRNEGTGLESSAHLLVVDPDALPERRRCRRSPHPWAGCLPDELHGHLLPLTAGGFVAATGSPRLFRYDGSRRLVTKLDTRLAGNHLMDFAVNRREDVVAAVGSCVYRPGVALLDLRTGESRLSTHDPDVCGERIVFAESTLVVGRNAGQVAVPRPGTILVVNPASGGIAEALRTPAEVVDLFALG
jgi:hypothetical protein